MARKSRYDIFDQIHDMCESERSRIGILCNYPLDDDDVDQRVWQVVYLHCSEWRPIKDGVFTEFHPNEYPDEAFFIESKWAGQSDFEVLAQSSSVFTAIHNAMDILREYGATSAIDFKERDKVRDQNEAIYKRDNHICVYCGNHATHIDHIVAKVNGGEDIPSNKVATCQPCNNSKSDAAWLFWYRAQRFYSVEREAYIEGIIKGA